MQNHPASGPKDKQRPGRIRLPFEKRPGDPGAWSYDHRAGICITVIVYLLFAIGFLWWKIDLGKDTSEAMILVDFPDELPRHPEAEPERQMQSIEDFSAVRNLTSNEAMELDARLRDDRGSNASEIYESAGTLDDRLRANREAYEEGLRLEREIIESARRGTRDGTERTTTRQMGTVTVSYYFTDPVRYDLDLVIPAYRCERGGQVVVNVTLDVNGKVTSASVDRGLSITDECMQSTAIAAARGSRFNLDTSAPSRHRGTITYTFIPQ
ncbi:MAG: energy transducer TonB [Rikenellaceae bacterium]|nr:energy transducer TonB [Rikenellaceae bacterium]